MTKKIDVIEFYDRQTGELCREKVMGDALIKWAYQTLSGKILSKFIFGSSIISKIIGRYFDSSLSKSKIEKTIIDLGIDESEFALPKEQFTSFNDFFTRKLKDDARPFSNDKNHFISPADGRLLVYDNIGSSSKINVKGINSSFEHLFSRKIDEFDNGKIAVVRLCPADYHRYHFPCAGKVVEEVNLSGEYHSVNPVALAEVDNLFCLNKRSYTIIDTNDFGRIAYMEVGAFGVAGIHKTFEGRDVNRMQEKGYFDFGGSTIVIVFQKNKINFSDDLLQHSSEGVETLVKVGETIAYKI